MSLEQKKKLVAKLREKTEELRKMREGTQVSAKNMEALGFGKNREEKKDFEEEKKSVWQEFQREKSILEEKIYSNLILSDTHLLNILDFANKIDQNKELTFAQKKQLFSSLKIDYDYLIEKRPEYMNLLLAKMKTDYEKLISGQLCLPKTPFDVNTGKFLGMAYINMVDLGFKPRFPLFPWKTLALSGSPKANFENYVDILGNCCFLFDPSNDVGKGRDLSFFKIFPIERKIIALTKKYSTNKIENEQKHNYPENGTNSNNNNLTQMYENGVETFKRHPNVSSLNFSKIKKPRRIKIRLQKGGSKLNYLEKYHSIVPPVIEPLLNVYLLIRSGINIKFNRAQTQNPHFLQKGAVLPTFVYRKLENMFHKMPSFCRMFRTRFIHELFQEKKGIVSVRKNSEKYRKEFFLSLYDISVKEKTKPQGLFYNHHLTPLGETRNICPFSLYGVPTIEHVQGRNLRGLLLTIEQNVGVYAIEWMAVSERSGFVNNKIEALRGKQVKMPILLWDHLVSEQEVAEAKLTWRLLNDSEREAILQKVKEKIKNHDIVSPNDGNISKSGFFWSDRMNARRKEFFKNKKSLDSFVSGESISNDYLKGTSLGAIVLFMSEYFQMPLLTDLGIDRKMSILNQIFIINFIEGTKKNYPPQEINRRVATRYFQKIPVSYRLYYLRLFLEWSGVFIKAPKQHPNLNYLGKTNPSNTIS